jgi:hypothetical protein
MAFARLGEGPVKRRAATAVLAGIIAALAAASPAGAAGPDHKAVIEGFPPNDPAQGRAVLNLLSRTGPWESTVRMVRLNPGLYEYAVQVGEDLDGNGMPDTFSLHPVCRFLANQGGAGGCTGTTDLGGRTEITPWTTAMIIDRTGPATFATATGPFV